MIVDGIRLGELRVAGLSERGGQARLAADAALIAQLVQHESEMDGVAEELVQAQDQILALYDLARAARSHLGLSDTLAALACETARLVETDGAGVLFVPAEGEPTLGAHGAAVPEVATLLAVFDRLPANGRPLVLSGPAAAPYLAADGHDLLMVPVDVRGTRAAALALVRAEGRAPFASPEIKLAHAIAEQAGSQIENVLLHEETVAQARLADRDGAGTVGAEAAAAQPCAFGAGSGLDPRTVPALQVGGDFYDFITTQPREPGCAPLRWVTCPGKGCRPHW